MAAARSTPIKLAAISDGAPPRSVAAVRHASTRSPPSCLRNPIADNVFLASSAPCWQVPEEHKNAPLSAYVGCRIVTSFPNITAKFFKPLDDAASAASGTKVQTSIRVVGGSVEAACGLGLADAVVDLVETGTTMKAAGYAAKL